MRQSGMKSGMGESNSLNTSLALGDESKYHEITSISPPIVCEFGGSSMDQTECSSIAISIEKSKEHWSELWRFDSTYEVAKVSNIEHFRTLQGHPTWGGFFKTFGEGEDSWGELVMGKKFAEGGQAELYKVQVKWKDPEMIRHAQKIMKENVLKVFKKGTSLHQLQSQWPQGMLQMYEDAMRRTKLGLPQPLRFYCDVHSATLLEDGRFAFLMVEEDNDLRNIIEERMLTRPNDKGPFPKDEAESIMYEIACGVNQLHGQGIVHRDIKASNVLWSQGWGYFIADFECSIGVVGTGFWRAPEVLEACKHGIVSKKLELFTKAVDVYGYGMMCYEILTGKLPFEGHPQNDYDLVLRGQRPKLPKDVDDWMCKLLRRCWQSDPLARPSFGEILKVILANSKICREYKLAFERQEVKAGIRKDSKVAKLRRSLKTMKLKIMD